MPRPVLVGMNNPISADPEHALYPHPPGCAGARLFHMLEEQLPNIKRRDYLQAFERVNLVTGDWSATAGRRGAAELLPRLTGRMVCLLGRDVLQSFGLHRGHVAAPLAWQHTLGLTGGFGWCLVPHPSGRNTWYNDKENRTRTGRLLATLYNDYLKETQI